MTRRANGQLRRSQVVTTYGPGALIDLPRDSAIVGGLDTWPMKDLDPVHEQRLIRKLQVLTGLSRLRLYAPPSASRDPQDGVRGIGAYRFPEWFVVRQADAARGADRRRRLVSRRNLDGIRSFEGQPVVATRFVRACPNGHVDDLDWRDFAHGGHVAGCRRPLWLDETGTSGDLAELVVRCECGRSRTLGEAKLLELNPLGNCTGRRPWLGNNREACDQRSRLLIRTASNAYFPQVFSVLSLPERSSLVQAAVLGLWNDLQIVDSADELTFAKKHPRVTQGLAGFADADVLEAIQAHKQGPPAERPVKDVELEVLVAAPEGFGDGAPLDPDYHARRLPDGIWRRSKRSDGIEAVVQVHRLREVVALVGFTRLEPVLPDIHGEFESDVRRAPLAQDPQWFPAVENRGEGIFVQLRASAVSAWSQRDPVRKRFDSLRAGHARWASKRETHRPFPGGPYVLLHTLSHLLIQSLAMRCGYPASSIKERVYADEPSGRFGILFYTGSPDAEGTLGGLVQQAQHVETHLADALRQGALCANDPVCAQHDPSSDLEDRWLHGAACHGCTLVAETSCEMRNDHLDRALVVPVLGSSEAAFFGRES